MTIKIFKWIVMFLLLLVGIAGLYFFLFRKNSEEIEGLPSQVSEFMTVEDLEELEELDYQVHYGLNPPNIEGVYLTNSQRIDYDKHQNAAVDRKISDVHDYFFDQNEDLEVSRNSDTLLSNLKRVGNVGYISGEDNCFTVFDIGKTRRRFGCVTTSAELVSGCLDEEGNIEDFKIAILMLNYNSNVLCVHLPRITKVKRPITLGNIRIISERDGVAQRVEQ